MRRCRFLVLSLSLFALSVAVAAPVPRGKQSREPFWVLPWGIASEDGKTAYITGQHGKVEALDLTTGKVRWTCDYPGKPLALVGRRLAVEIVEKDKPNSVRILFLNPNGKQEGQSDAVKYPDWVVIGRTSGPGFASGMYSSSAWSDGSTLYLTWRARGGAPAGGGRAGMEKGGRGGGGKGQGGGRGGQGGRGGARKTADGVAKIDISSGKVEMLETDDAPEKPSPKMPANIAPAARLGRGEFGSAAPVGRIGKHAVTVAIQRSGEERQAVLRRWDLTTGKALDPIVLEKTAAARVILAADRRTVLVHVRDRNAQEEDTSFWHVYSTETGKKVGTFIYQDGMTSITALAGRVFFVARAPAQGDDETPKPWLLRCLDMKTGQLLYQHAIEMTRPTPRGGRFRE